MRGMRSCSVTLAMFLAACASGPGLEPVDDWEIVVQAPESAVGTVAGGQLDRTFQADLIDELQSARGIPARVPNADELVDGTRDRTLYLEAVVHPGSTGRLINDTARDVAGVVRAIRRS